MNRFLIRSVLAVLLAGVAGPSLAAAPCESGNVRVISPHGTGVSDLMARVMASELTARLGKTFYVEPMTGAGGAIGVRAIAEAAPDGCTIGIVGLSTLVVGPQVEKDVGYDPAADFSPLGMIGGSPAVFAVKAGLGIASFDDLIAQMKSGKLVPTISTPGRSTITAILPQVVFAHRGVEGVLVPFKDTSEALLAAVSGDVDAVSLSYSTLRPQIDSGALVPLFVSSGQRLKDMPNVPTLAEIGEPDLETLIWFGLAGPKGMPQDMVDQINGAMNAALADAKAAEPLVTADVTLEPMTSAEMSALVSRQTAAYATAIAQIGQK